MPPDLNRTPDYTMEYCPEWDVWFITRLVDGDTKVIDERDIFGNRRSLTKHMQAAKAHYPNVVGIWDNP
jgi:hypothetical protein